MKRTVFAKISVNDEVNNGQVIDTLEKQALEMAHCDLEEAICAEEDSDSRHERYINYLMNWAIDHNDEKFEGCSPVGFDEFEDCEGEEIEYDLALGLRENDFELDETAGNISINKKKIYYNTDLKVGQLIRIWFVDEDDPLRVYKVIGITDEKLICEFIG